MFDHQVNVVITDQRAPSTATPVFSDSWTQTVFEWQLFIAITLVILFMAMRVYNECAKAGQSAAAAIAVRATVRDERMTATPQPTVAVLPRTDEPAEASNENEQKEGHPSSPSPVPSEGDTTAVDPEELARFAAEYAAEARQFKEETAGSGSVVMLGHADAAAVPGNSGSATRNSTVSEFVKAEAGRIFASHVRGRMFRMSVIARAVVFCCILAVLYALYWLYTSPIAYGWAIGWLFAWCSNASEVTDMVLRFQFYGQLIRDHWAWISGGIVFLLAWLFGYSFPTSLSLSFPSSSPSSKAAAVA